MVFVVGASHAEIILPGSQPKEHDYRFLPVDNCVKCHSKTTNGLADPYFSWQGGMMAQAARDPVFRAALAIANQDIPGSGEYCIRCHSPRGWLEGRSTAAPDGALLKGDDLEGVSCHFCHRLVDPLSAEAKLYAKVTPPGYGNGMYVMDTNRVLRGPYANANGLPMHAMALSAYHASSELCGNCHNVSNPLQATNAAVQKPESYGHIERTYSEWLVSDSKSGQKKSCQDCHFPLVPSGGQAVKYQSKHGDLHRDHFASHSAAGGSTWAQDAVLEIWGEHEVDRDALEAGKENARRLLKTAAKLNVEITERTTQRDRPHLAVTITNLTGHKLPTGYPEGRRMWLNVRFLQGAKVLDEVGRYAEKDDVLVLPEVSMSAVRMGELMPSVPKLGPGKIAVKLPTLIDPERTRVYESKPGMSASQSKKHGLAEGASFHFVLNDVITKDNRIPPRGFQKAIAAEHLSGAVDADYAQGQYWDSVDFAVPDGTERVEVRLMYQSMSWEYLKFLVEENRTDGWGRRLYEAWEKTGRCEPTVMAQTDLNLKK